MNEPKSNQQSFKQWGISLFILAFVAFGSYSVYQTYFCEQPASSIPELGAEIGPFELSNHLGQVVTHRSFGDKYLLVAFGYTFCPDICPTQLSAFGDALDMLGDHSHHIQPLLITLDPERDNPEVLSHFVEAFHPDLIGLTGGHDEISKVASRLSVYFEKAGDTSDPNSYSVDHSALGYLVSPHGKLLTVFPYGSSPEFVSARISRTLHEGKSQT